MDNADLAFFKNWFNYHVTTFHTATARGQGAILLKEEHTQRVCKEIVKLCRDLGLSEPDVLLAEAAALFHDIGRFSQWMQYGTFVDSQSEDHALLGLRMLSSHEVLERIPRNDKEVIREAIRQHNKREVSTTLAPRQTFFAKLLRDADKLDIWRVALHYARDNGGPRKRALEGRTAATSLYSRNILAKLRQREPADLCSVCNRNDLILLRLGWAFDLNFVPTCRRVLERYYIERLCNQLPATQELEGLQHDLISYLHARVSAPCDGPV